MKLEKSGRIWDTSGLYIDRTNWGITLPTKVLVVKAMVFPVVMYRCESLTIKKAECRRIHIFEWWCWRTVLRITWTAERSYQSILKEINPEYSLEGLMLKLQYFGLLMRIAPDLGKDWRQEEKGMMEDEMVEWLHWLNGHEFEQAPGVGDGRGSLACRSLWGRIRQTPQSDWAQLGNPSKFCKAA